MPSNEVQVLPEAGRPDTTKTLSLAGGLSLDEVKSIGTVFFQSGMFQDAKSAAQAITKVLAGQEMGVPPMAAMRGLYVTKRGNIEFMAGLMAAQIKRSGKYRYDVVQADAKECRLAWFERGDNGGWRDLGETKFTIEQAKKAGLAGKDTYEAYGEDMLFNRALSRGARRHCPDLFLGAVHVLGETVPEDLDKPAPFVQQTPSGGYTPPRVAPLHDDEDSGESRSASSHAHEEAAHPTDDAAGDSAPSEAPSGADSSLFPPSEEEIAALEADAAHRDPQA